MEQERLRQTHLGQLKEVRRAVSRRSALWRRPAVDQGDGLRRALARLGLARGSDRTQHEFVAPLTQARDRLEAEAMMKEQLLADKQRLEKELAMAV
eukprot:2403846-Pleurochrysis_carterae.AAC.3